MELAVTRIGRRSALWCMLGLAAESLPAAEPSTKLKEGGGEIEVSFESEQFDLPHAALLAWVSQAAKAVTAYYGKYPVPRARVRIFSGGGQGVSRLDGGPARHGETVRGAWCRFDHDQLPRGDPGVAANLKKQHSPQRHRERRGRERIQTAKKRRFSSCCSACGLASVSSSP